MASLKDIRVRIESTKNTQQITKAMKLVSASKLRKAQAQILNMRPYAQSLLSVIANIAVTHKMNHPLLETHLGNGLGNSSGNEETHSSGPLGRRLLVVVITSDRGLCGGFNSNVIKFTEKFMKEDSHKEDFSVVDFIFVGRKGADFFIRRGVKPVEVIHRLDRDISYDLASRVAHQLMDNYINGKYEEIRLIYNEFKSAISQAIVCETLLPVDVRKQNLILDGQTNTADMILEPNPFSIIDKLLVKHFSVQVYRCMAESVASEHGARMTAMENATNNARDVLSKLTLTYNKLRQEKITTELVEIVGGAEAL